MEKLYKFEVYCGQGRDISAVFIAEEKDVKEAVGNEAHFGEILGKHSDVSIILDQDHFKVMTDDQEYIKKTKEIMGNNINGYNPLLYIVCKCDKCKGTYHSHEMRPGAKICYYCEE